MRQGVVRRTSTSVENTPVPRDRCIDMTRTAKPCRRHSVHESPGRAVRNRRVPSASLGAARDNVDVIASDGTRWQGGPSGRVLPAQVGVCRGRHPGPRFVAHRRRCFAQGLFSAPFEA